MSVDTRAPIRCAKCASELVGDVTDDGLVMPDGQNVSFRRHTDYVVCSCLASYRVSDLRAVVDHVEARMRSYTAS